MSEPGLIISRTVSYPNPTLLYHATDRERLRARISETLSLLADLTGPTEEPMLTLIVFADTASPEGRDRHRAWTVLLFPPRATPPFVLLRRRARAPVDQSGGH